MSLMPGTLASEPYRLTEYRTPAVMLSTGFQMSLCPGNACAVNVESMHCIRPLDGCPAAAFEFPVRTTCSSSRAVHVPSSVVTHQTSPRPASSLRRDARVTTAEFLRTAASGLQPLSV